MNIMKEITNSMYTIKEAAKILRIKSVSSLLNKIKRHGISPLKTGKKFLLTKEMLDDLRKNRESGRAKNKKDSRKRKTSTVKKVRGSKYYWRVSVWNDELMGYVVVKCGLSRKEADEFAAGKNAVKRPCWR